MIKDKVAIISLGSYGDVINSLPIIKYYSEITPVDIIICQPYVTLMEGISYATSFIPPFRYGLEDISKIIDWTKAGWSTVVNVMLACHPDCSRTRYTSFCEEMYHLGGVHDIFNKRMPIFDRRDRKREWFYLKQFPLSHPIIALSLVGNSHASFTEAKRQQVWHHLHQRFPECTLIDVHKNFPYRIFDLLGLFDIAKVLVTIDTAHLHLAKASSVPTIEINAGLETWRDATPGPNCKMRLNDRELNQRLDEMVDVIRGLL